MKTQNLSDIKPNTIIGEDHDGWINLPAWKGFQTRNGTYTSKDTEEPSDVIIKTHTIGNSVDYVHLLSQVQYVSIQYLIQNSEKVRDSLLKALLKEHPNSKEIYKNLMPEISSIEDYKEHIGLSFLHVMDSEKDGFAYYGFEMDCSWDDEHGVGVMMHKDKVIAVGLAEESFNHWTTYDDNGTSKQEEVNWEKANEHIARESKKWWKFWK
jgi:hypothetical protein